MNENFKKWLGRTAYQLIPDRFYRGDLSIEQLPGRILKDWNDRMPNWQPNEEGEYENNFFYGGNLRGVTEKLDYLKSLGFDMIYMTPVEESASYHHYDVGDQEKIDPWLGSWDDFRNLCKKAHALGMLIMVDLVFNHTGIHSKYFSDPKYHDWYEYDKTTGEHKFWWNFKTMPMCDKENKSYQEAMKNVCKLYLKNGADGIRLDLGEDLPRNFLYAIQEVKKEYPQCIFVGEMWGCAIPDDEEQRKNSKIIDGELDSVMNYPISDAILRWVRWGRSEHFAYYFNEVYNKYPESVQNILLNNIGSHDTPMTITMLAGEMMNNDVLSQDKIWDIEGPWRHGQYFDTYGFRNFEAENDRLPDYDFYKGKQYAKIALAIMYSLPGIPCVFQGTEIAETGYKDPFCRKPYDWDRDEKDMRYFVKCLGDFRKENSDVLSSGRVILLRIDSDVMCFERYASGKKLIFIANRSSREIEVDVGYGFGKVWVAPYSFTVR